MMFTLSVAALPTGASAQQHGREGPAAGLPAAHDSSVYRTVGGALLPTPDPATLDCDELRAVLSRIDGSDYRGAAALAEDDPDRALFDYENRVTAAHFERCLTPEPAGDDPGSAFRGGTWSQ